MNTESAPLPSTAAAVSRMSPMVARVALPRQAGGRASCGANLTDAYRLTGVCAGRILRGEMPGDLPIQQATKVELVVHPRTT